MLSMHLDTELSHLIAERIRDAAASGTPLRIRGGGSKDFYGQCLRGDVLDMAAFSGVISYEPSELVVTVRAGTRLADLENLLAAQGQEIMRVQLGIGQQGLIQGTPAPVRPLQRLIELRPELVGQMHQHRPRFEQPHRLCPSQIQHCRDF